jgi:hypothetical protein
MTLPNETIEKINKQAAYYSGYDENEDHTPISKGKYYGYQAGATEWAGKAQGLVSALEWIQMHTPIDQDVDDVITGALAKYKEATI